MFRCELVVGYVCRCSSSQGDVAHQVAECLGRSPVEPAAVQVKDCPAFPGLRRVGPPARYPTDGVFLKSNALRGFDPLDDAIERRAGGYTFELALHARHGGSQGGHGGGVFRGEGMDERPGIICRRAVVFSGLHLFLLSEFLVRTITEHFLLIWREGHPIHVWHSNRNVLVEGDQRGPLCRARLASPVSFRCSESRGETPGLRIASIFTYP